VLEWGLQIKDIFVALNHLMNGYFIQPLLEI
jgi:hypothetical protein